MENKSIPILTIKKSFCVFVFHFQNRKKLQMTDEKNGYIKTDKNQHI